MIDRLAAQLIDGSARKSRRDVELDQSPGLYALFLKPGCTLPGIAIPGSALIYLGKADGGGGLKSRCHFNGGTRNHSPRKSLAAILEAELGLVPRPIANADGSYKTWALEAASERVLDNWMHANLGVAYAIDPGAAGYEKQLIQRYAPILNLTDCTQGEVHRLVILLRKLTDARRRTSIMNAVADFVERSPTK